MEELHLENTALKHLSDTLSKRLHMWEVNSQSSSAVLQQSIRALQNSPKAVAVDAQPVSAQGQGGTDGSALKRLQELEETLKRVDAEKESVARENEKLKTVVSRYRDRWEKLKEGARVRREGTGPGTANPSGAGGEGDNKAFEGEI
jgi:predicted RNase H-like nuclease (RuvC/YqgF family)